MVWIGSDRVRGKITLRTPFHQTARPKAHPAPTSATQRGIKRQVSGPVSAGEMRTGPVFCFAGKKWQKFPRLR